MAKRAFQALNQQVTVSSKVKKHALAMVGAAVLLTLVVLLSAFGLGPRIASAAGRLFGVRRPFATIAPQYGSESVHFIGVGQGDAVLLQSGEEFCLIDTGPAEAQDELLHYIDAMNVKRLRLLVLSHPHADHIGNAAAVLEHLPVDALLLPDESLNTKEISFGLAKLKQGIPAQTSVQVGVAGQQFALGQGTLSVLFAGIEGTEFNNASLVVRYDGPSLSFLATGDSEAAEERALLRVNHLPNLQADVFKAAHHGSSGSNTQEFLQSVQPKIVVAGCAAQNDYGHPHHAAIRRVYDVGADFYDTRQGAVSVYGLGSGRYQVLVSNADASAAAA